MKGFYVMLLLFPIADCAIIVEKPTGGDGQLGRFPANQPEGVLPGATVEATSTWGSIKGYTIVADTNPGATFSIDSTGQLSLVTGKTFDFSTTPHYVLKIAVSDSTVTVTATATITIRKDKKGPVFAYNPTVLVDNMSPVGHVVTTYTATDVEDDPITYRIVDGNTNGDFAITSYKGIITVVNALDFTRTPTYILKVDATEHTTFIIDGTGTVTVNVCEAKCPTDGSSNIRTTWVQAVFMVAMAVLFRL